MGTKPYIRRTDITAVCTTDEARDYFEQKGLSYNDVTEGDIWVLVMLLQKELKKSVKDCETSVSTMTLSKKINIKKRPNGSITSCFLFVNSHYFEQRECISFNSDGFIGFAGWADQGNVNPILRAFLKWCDYLVEANDG